MNDLSDLERLHAEIDRLQWELFHAKKKLTKRDRTIKQFEHIVKKQKDRLNKLDPKDRYYNSNGKRKAGKRK